jgi:chemotaxis-related protein WspD
MNAATSPNHTTSAADTPTACWRSIGVHGDKSCPELTTAIHCRNCPVFARAAWTLFDRPADLADSVLSLESPGDTPRADVTARTHGAECLFVFQLGDQTWALDCSLVDEVAADAPVRRIAHRSSGLLEGLVNVRGELILSIALDRLLVTGGANHRAAVSQRASTDAPAQRTRRVIVGGPGQAWSFRATQVLGVHYVAPSALESVPPAMPSPLDRLLRGLLRLPASASPGSSADIAVNVLDGQALLSSFAQSV